MTLQLQYFAVLQSGQLKRIPRAVLERLNNRSEVLPEFAGQNIRVVEVLVSADENGAPRVIENISGFYMKIGDDGFLDAEAVQEGLRLVMDALSFGPVGGTSDDTKIVELKEAREKRNLEKAHRWQPSPQEERAIINAALAHHKATSVLPSNKVKKSSMQTEPEPLSWESREKLKDVSSKIWQIGVAVDHLPTGDLLAFAKEVSEKGSTGYTWSRKAWEAVRCHIDHRIALESEKKAGTGEWYAIVELIRWNEKEGYSDCEVVSEQKFKGRDAAVKALRQMLIEVSSKVESDVEVSARTVPAIEWDAENM